MFVDEKLSVRFGFSLGFNVSTFLFTTNQLERWICVKRLGKKSVKRLEKKKGKHPMSFSNASLFHFRLHFFFFVFIFFRLHIFSLVLNQNSCYKVFMYISEWMSLPTVSKTPYHLWRMICVSHEMFRFDFIKSNSTI